MATNLETKELAHKPTLNHPPDIAQLIANSGLKLNHQIFLNEYLVCRNAAESARKAGYNSKRPAIVGYKLLKKPEIRELVESFDKLKLEAAEAKVAKVVERDITREGYLTLAQNFIDECGPKHSNTPTYMTIIGKVKGFFSDMMTNNFLVYHGSDPEVRSSVDAKLAHFSRQLSRRPAPPTLESKPTKE